MSKRSVFERLGSRGKSVSACSDSYNRHSYLRYTEVLSKSEDSRGGNWKSRSKRKKSSGERTTCPSHWCVKSYDDLKKAFLENYLQQKKCIKDPIEIHNIKQREGESTEDFVKRYKLESKGVKRSNHIAMRITGFVQVITNP
ncbi:reverse transcriptase domain-containing protein [Tanacetum coccineum]